MEIAFDLPVGTFDLLEVAGASRLRLQAADEVNGFVAHLAILAQNAPVQSNDLAGTGKAGLRGSGFLGAGYCAQLHPPAIGFPVFGLGDR